MRIRKFRRSLLVCGGCPRSVTARNDGGIANCTSWRSDKVMAIIDPRILSLVETLADRGMDWLVFELMEGIQDGRSPQESEEALAAARDRATENSGQYREALHRDVAPSETAPIVGDDQLRWAVGYIKERLRDTIDALDASFDCLETLGLVNERVTGGAQGGAIRVTFVEDESPINLTRGGLSIAREGLGALQHALDVWLADTLNPTRSR